MAKEEIAIFIEDIAIASLFSELAEAHGAISRIAINAQQLSGASRVITEPQFFPLLSKDQKKNALVVSNGENFKDAKVTLRRPLTAERVENALDKLMC